MSSTMIVSDLHHGRKHKPTYGEASIWDYNSINTLKELIALHSPQHLILLGDIFDSGKPTALSYSEFIATIAQVPQVLILTGNHDLTKIDEEIAFNNLHVLPNVEVAPQDAAYTVRLDGKWFTLVGWHSTQDLFDTEVRTLLTSMANDSFLIVHASRVYFGNDNDNYITDRHMELAKEKNISIISGHDHIASLGSVFSHLGSVTPHAINQVGARFYWLDGEFMPVPNNNKLVLTREEPLEVDPDKCYYVKRETTVEEGDLKLEAHDLGIDIVKAFWEAATAEGFDKGILNA